MQYSVVLLPACHILHSAKHEYRPGGQLWIFLIVYLQVTRRLMTKLITIK